jgi:hypothetical protein
MSENFKIGNPDGDFLQIQNYVLQLVAEGKLHFSTFVLYAFYRSVGGFSEIRFSYETIGLNTNLSKGAISAGNKQLKENGLIIIKDNGKNKCNNIYVIPGSSLPRRKLKKAVQITDSSNIEQPVQKMNTNEPECSKNVTDKHSTIKNSSIKNNTTKASTTKETEVEMDKQTPEQAKFIEDYIKFWTHQYKTKRYRKNDLYKVSEIDDLEQATKMIPVLWCIQDKWVEKSDYSLSVFVKEYKSGKLHSTLPNTRYGYQEA